MSGFLHEIKQALASLQRVPNFAATVVITMGLTLGTLMCIGILSHLLLFKPLAYEDNDRLYSIKGVIKANGNTVMSNVNSFASARHLYEANEFETSAMMTFEQHQLPNVNNQPIITVTYTPPEYFHILDVPLALGRSFSESEKLNTYNPVAVISYNSWQQFFGGRPDILQQKITISERSFNIIGVAAERFDEPVFYGNEFDGSSVYLPWDFHAGDERARNNWGSISEFTTVIAKLKVGVTPQQVEQVTGDALNRAFNASLSPNGQPLPYSMGVETATFETVILGDSQSTTLILLAGALTLLLIACSNVINLMLSRTVQKQRQLTIRATLGANQGHLFKIILAENLILMSLVSIIAIVVAYFGFDVLQTMGTEYLSRLGELSMSGMSVIVTLAIALLLSLAFSLISIGIVDYKKLQASIQASGKGSGLQIKAWVRSLLITSQVALVGLLIVANISVLKNASDVIYRPLGLNSQDLSYFSLVHRGGELTSAEREQMTADVIAALEKQPQINSVSYASSGPTRPNNGGTILRFADDKSPVNAMQFFVSHNYLDVLKQPMIEGRAFNADEVKDRAKVAIVTRTTAEKLYPGESAVGKTIFQSMERTVPYTIVGVAEDLTLPPTLEIIVAGDDMNKNHLYMPGLSIQTNPEFRLMVRFEPNQGMSKEQLLAVVSKVDPELRAWMLMTTEDRKTELLVQETTTAQITIALTLLSMLLAGVGIYGIFNYNTQLRRFEIGTRMSLGASPNDIVKLIFKDNAKPVLMGIAASLVLGVVAYSMARQYIDSYLHMQIQPLVISLILLLSMAILSSYLPLHKIVKRWPIFSIRQ